MKRPFSKRPARFPARWSVLLLAVFLTCSAVPFAPPALAVERSPELDAALSMLEEGNPFLAAYNAQTGADIAARYPDGCPYFFAGKDVSLIGTVCKAWDSAVYFKAGQYYPAGLDCVGFTRWVFAESGRREHPAISSMLGSRGKQYQIEMTEGQPARILFEFLEAGDLLAVRHARGGFHVMMYIGTLRSFGYTEETVGEGLSDKLDYPLMIHCSSNRDYSERYTLWIRKNAKRANTTDGGVMISLFGCPDDGCDGVMLNLDKSSLSYYMLDGYRLTVCNLEDGASSRWIRYK